MKSWVSDMGFEDTPMVPSPLVVPRHWGFNPTSPWPLPIYIYIKKLDIRQIEVA